IKVVGNPIARKVSNIKTTYKNNNFNVGIALNPVADNTNREMIKHVLSNSLSKEISFMIKLHPSMRKTKWMKDIISDRIIFYETKDISHKDYFELIDLLVVGNSGLGYEAVINDVPIWVYNVTNSMNGHDSIMVEKGNCPDITEIINLNLELYKLMNKSDYLRELLELEQEFVLNEFYYAIGDDATLNIINEINKLV
ncbi:MAG: hypothetical protein PHY08_14275, partial [Candidatus Cloacimonetes bacterium]|nr:hypothetical protein [Candidatus Cloacimonadota bacterium]